jgi:hypothetical protein
MKKENNNPKREKALGKIRKMMALANDPSASEGEVENALKFSQKLMAEFNIENDEVELSQDDIDIIETPNSYTNLERKYWFWDLLSVIAESNDCSVLQSQKVKDFKDVNRKDTGKEKFYDVYYKIIGTRNDRVLTKELFEMSVPIIRNLADRRFKELQLKHKENPLMAILEPLPTKRFFVASYIDGFVRGLDFKLKQNKHEIKKEDETGKFGLMIVKKDALVQGFINNMGKKIKEAKTTTATGFDQNAFRMGIEDGKENTSKKLM